MKKVLVFFVIFSVTALLASAWAQAEFPKSLKGVVPEYPGAAVVACVDLKESAQVEMDVDADPKIILDFYKRAMEERGWRVEMESSSPEASTLAMKKGEQTLKVTVFVQASGRTRINLFFLAE